MSEVWEIMEKVLCAMESAFWAWMRFDADSTLSASAIVALASFLMSLRSSFEEMTDSAMLLRPPMRPRACPALCSVARLWI